jgi:hypothetical protein
MGRHEEHEPLLPPRIRAAFDFLNYAQRVTEQCDASIPVRDLSALEKSVQAAALRTVQQYLMGEMDFVEEPGSVRPPKGDDDDSPATPVNSTN